jgi:ABC-type polysaccharide/polyol phosphate export permease
VVEYGRMFRLMLWSILPYAVMAALIGVAFKALDGIDDKAVLESQVDRASHIAICASLLLFVLAQAIVESGRAAFIADGNLRSATRAFGRGFMQLLRRPFSTLFCYLLISLVGYAIALALGVGRLNTPALGVGGLVLAMLLAQLVVLVIGWVRVARLYALAEVARSLPSRRGGGRSPAL